jgi:hypothetical protein
MVSTAGGKSEIAVRENGQSLHLQIATSELRFACSRRGAGRLTPSRTGLTLFDWSGMGII